MISLIISTYNRPDALRLVLLALAEQSNKDFEVVIADDGSTDATKQVIEELKKQVIYKVKHVWQQHDGFRAATIRNKAVATADGDYLIFLDGDVIPRASFVQQHQCLAEDGYFVSGNRILLFADFTKEVLLRQLPVCRWKLWQWFKGFCHHKVNSFLSAVILGDCYWRYWCRAKWQGAKTCNLGMWKKDFFAVNGFDESYVGWGYEDSDLLIRLIRHGVGRKDGRFAVSVLHLWHAQNSRSRELINYNKLQTTINSRHIKAPVGVNQYAG